MLAIVCLTLVLAACSGAPPERDGVSTTEVCQRVIEAQEDATEEGRLAARNRDTAERLLPVATLAQDAADPELAALGERLELHAANVLERLDPDASDDEATIVAGPMLRESVLLYSGCLRHIGEEAQDAVGE